MKILSFAWIIFIGVNGFSQEVDSLVIFYRIGYKCSPEMDGEEKRGACGRKEEINYEKKKHVYRITKFECKESFREWVGQWEISQDSITKKEVKTWIGGFGPNLISDSVSHPKIFKDRRISGKDLNTFLRSIVAIKADTVFSYTMKEIPVSYLEKHFPDGQNDKEVVDSLLQHEFSSLAISNVTGYLFLSFQYQGIRYELCKDSNNAYWNLYINEAEWNTSIQFIHFAFDTFIKEELPRRFSGLSVLK